MLYSCTHVAPLGVKGLNSADVAPRDKLARIDEQLPKPCSLSLFLEIIKMQPAIGKVGYGTKYNKRYFKKTRK